MRKTENPLRIYTLKEAASMMRISVATLRQLIKDGEIKTVAIGKSRMIKFTDIFDYVNRDY